MPRTTATATRDDDWTARERLEGLWVRTLVTAGSRLRPLLVRTAETASGEVFLSGAGVEVDQLHRLTRRTPV